MTRDRILLEGMAFYGYHGADPAERELGQRFVVDLEVHRDLKPAGLSDDVGDTVSYTRLYSIVKDVVEGPSRSLLESLAEAIAHRVISDCDAESVRVRVKKPEVPIKGSMLTYAGVEVFRERVDGASKQDHA